MNPIVSKRLELTLIAGIFLDGRQLDLADGMF
jgi:hypothetical protein